MATPAAGIDDPSAAVRARRRGVAQWPPSLWGRRWGWEGEGAARRGGGWCRGGWCNRLAAAGIAHHHPTPASHRNHDPSSHALARPAAGLRSHRPGEGHGVALLGRVQHDLRARRRKDQRASRPAHPRRHGMARDRGPVLPVGGACAPSPREWSDYPLAPCPAASHPLMYARIRHCCHHARSSL